MFNVDQNCVLINSHDCYKSIDTSSKELSNAALNGLFICHVNIVSCSKNINKLEEFLDKFAKTTSTLFALAKLG